MNERIRELEQQCVYWDADDETYEFDREKFAELIVSKCCEIAHCNFHVDGLTLGNILREYFGIEE